MPKSDVIIPPTGNALSGINDMVISNNSGINLVSANSCTPRASSPAANTTRRTLVVLNAYTIGNRWVALKRKIDKIMADRAPLIKPMLISVGFVETKIVLRKRTISKPSLNTAVKTRTNKPRISCSATVFLIFCNRNPFCWEKNL